MSAKNTARAWAALLIAAAIAGFVWWLFRPPERPREPLTLRDEPAEPAEPALEPAPAPAEPPVAAPSAGAPKPEVADDGIGFIPHDPNEPRPDGPLHPHPITPQHQRIFQENRLVGALNGAMDVEDAAGMRRLLAQYREEFPEDTHVLQDGYAIIADCFDKLDDATRAAAQHYYDTELASNIRRYVRRYCLER